jgi:hypothetical protein
MVERVLAGLVVVPFLLGAAAAPTSGSRVVFSFQDPRIVESSGLAVVGGSVVTTNDSGDSGRVFTVDPATGRTAGTTTYDDQAVDVEALAPDGHGHVWVGDIGDNLGSRSSVQVILVPAGSGGDRAVDAESYDLVYPDGAHDAETLVCDPTTGRLYVATKEPLGGTLYAAPRTLDPEGANRLEPVGDVLPIATDGTFLAGGTRLVVRNYGTAAVYAFPSLEKLDQLRLPAQPQGEGIAVDRDGTLLLSSEGLHSDVLRVSLPSEPTASPSTEPTTSPTPPPAASQQESSAQGTVVLERAQWPWLVGGLVGVGCLLVLTRRLRRR